MSGFQKKRTVLYNNDVPRTRILGTYFRFGYPVPNAGDPGAENNRYPIVFFPESIVLRRSRISGDPISET